jgi:alpha-L-fucosidase
MNTPSQTFLAGSLFLLAFCVPDVPREAEMVPGHDIAPGRFVPTWESFEKQYQCPSWFRDAKFGIWAHWSAQCVPEAGDWYARHMYIQGTAQYNHHLARYGHPSKSGFMEIDNLWKAEKWEPEKLMQLYVRAGAKYFVALANHHDNFDTYDSKYHQWNSVRVGPKKDIIGIWEKIARAHGLRFGVSNHSAHAWHWFQTAYGYDGEGPLAGVRYDADRLTRADGKGKWWDGLDPQELYTGPNIRMPDGLQSAKAVAEWQEKHTSPWREDASPENAGFVEKWFLRCQDLVDKYHPDLIYFDDYGLPFGQTGLDIVAHIYNANASRHAGTADVVVTAKQLKGDQNGGIVEDFERGFVEDIKEHSWQTCTCIGNWHYDREIYRQHKYKTVTQVVHQLIDIVSKNGNLLLSIPVRGDGSIDELETAFLEGMAAWMKVNGEAIFATRPWKVFGEGPTQVKGGMFNEGDTHFTPNDIRFTKRGDTLYAFLLGIPRERRVIIKTLGSASSLMKGRSIKNMSLVGFDGTLSWKQTPGGLFITLPSHFPCEHALALRIRGTQW